MYINYMKFIHMLIAAVQSVGRFFKITENKGQDKNFLNELELISHKMVVFDCAYNYYMQFALCAYQKVYFVIRMKKNADFTVVETLRTHKGLRGKAMI
jgi:hypothetical protein